MARSADTSSVIERLRFALERAKTLDDGTILESQPMSELMGFSWPTIRKWCDTYPAIERPELFTRGGNGVKWQFQPIPFINALLGQFAAEADKRGEQNRKLQQQVGVTLPEEEQTADIDTMRKLVGLSIDVTQTKVKQGFYTPTQEVVDFLDGYNQTVVDGIMGVGSEIDPTGQLPAHISDQINERLLVVATRVHSKAQKYVEEKRASLQQKGVGPSG